MTSISRKPLSIALDEVAAGKITYHRIIDPDAEGEEVVEEGPPSEPSVRACLTAPAVSRLSCSAG